eukprot:GHVL01021201.1.p1 GENE.GHVL01021201.1~~GHVL01021201.1.p1  ORF type:complete len:228 (-),score=-10.53 GHVL01021201.1:494-1177(-)
MYLLLVNIAQFSQESNVRWYVAIATGILSVFYFGHSIQVFIDHCRTRRVEPSYQKRKKIAHTSAFDMTKESLDYHSRYDEIIKPRHKRNLKETILSWCGGLALGITYISLVLLKFALIINKSQKTVIPGYLQGFIPTGTDGATQIRSLIIAIITLQVFLTPIRTSVTFFAMLCFELRHDVHADSLGLTQDIFAIFIMALRMVVFGGYLVYGRYTFKRFFGEFITTCW